ncbi:OsmC family protein [Paraglaciecola aquimarina]|uniref:OsmC family protein n=1 Tax=Paraglaciecola aquimarina TaxID=1235557 RepID=A0ABU3SZL5_9ALTE|nr:OsmC family protein [Paraglaciecola aquimarina]MDU0355362.1 OsmC family protein [Paraglaciecola aquimarina]
MQAKVTWQQDMKFSCETNTGHTLEMDGNGEAPSPMEAVLLAVGACSSIDVVEILKKARQDMTDCVCELTSERAETAPRVFTKIHAHYQIKGNNISEKHLTRAVQLSAEKYCSVMLMLSGKVEITTSYEIA